METRANYIAVGLFTLLAIVTVFAGIYWFENHGEDENLVPINVRIEGSVSGLGPASAVQFNGITVGRVDTLTLDQADPRFVIIRAMISASTPVRADTKASIGIRGLSGGAFLQLEGGSPAATPLLSVNATGADVATIEGDPAAVADLLERVSSIAGRTEEIMITLEKFVRENSDSLSRTLNNAETFSNALSENSDGVAKFMDSAGNVAISLERLATKLDGSINRAEEILQAVEPQSVKNTIDNIESFSQSLAEQRGEIDAMVATVNSTAQQLSTFSQNLNQSLAKADGVINKVDGVVSAVNPEEVANAVSGIGKSAQRAEQVLEAIDPTTVKTTLGNIEVFSKTLADQREQIASMMDTINQTAERLNAFSNDLSGTLTKVDGLASAVDPQDVASAAKSIENSAKRAEQFLNNFDADGLNDTIAQANATATRARQIVEGIDEKLVRDLLSNLGRASEDVSKLVAGIDAAKINSAVDNVSSAASGAREIIDDVARITGPLGERGQDVQKIVTDISELASRLNESSKRVDGILDQVNTFVGSNSTSGLMADVTQTLAEFRTAAQNFDKQVASAVRGINNFTKRGLSDTQGLIRDARQSLKGIDRVMRNLQNNPSSLITGAGGSRVRESSIGRVRR